MLDPLGGLGIKLRPNMHGLACGSSGLLFLFELFRPGPTGFRVYWGYVGIMEKKMEISIMGLYRV